MARKSSLDRLIEDAERFASGCSRSRLELRLVDAIHRLRKENEALKSAPEGIEYIKLRDNMAGILLLAAPKPIPLNVGECQAQADAILSTYNVKLRDNDNQ